MDFVNIEVKSDMRYVNKYLSKSKSIPIVFKGDFTCLRNSKEKRISHNQRNLEWIKIYRSLESIGTSFVVM